MHSIMTKNIQDVLGQGEKLDRACSTLWICLGCCWGNWAYQCSVLQACRCCQQTWQQAPSCMQTRQRTCIARYELMQEACKLPA